MNHSWSYESKDALHAKKQQDARDQLTALMDEDPNTIDDAVRIAEKVDLHPNAALTEIGQIKKIRARVLELLGQGILSNEEALLFTSMNSFKAELHLGILQFVCETVPKMRNAGEISDEMALKLSQMNPILAKRYIQGIQHLQELFPKAKEAGIMDDTREKELKAMDPLLAELKLLLSFPKEERPEAKNEGEE